MSALTAGTRTFERPPSLQATNTPEDRGLARDEVRLLVSTPDGHGHRRFHELADVLTPGDLLVVNRSATVRASVPATVAWGPFRLSLSTRYGPRAWLVEPRVDHATPGPVPIAAGDRATVADVPVRFVAPYPGIPRLWLLHADGDLAAAAEAVGEPIRYGYLDRPQPLDAYATVFGDTPGSAEMPSAARPFTPRVLTSLVERGIGIARVTLHTGVSSLELEDLSPSDDPADLTLYPEPFDVPAATVDRIAATRRAGGRVIAVGTTVVRALASVAEGTRLRPGAGFTRRVVTPDDDLPVLDGLLTGLHDPEATHLSMLYAVAGRERVLDGYRAAVAAGYLWHEFGDSHLLLR